MTHAPIGQIVMILVGILALVRPIKQHFNLYRSRK